MTLPSPDQTLLDLDRLCHEYGCNYGIPFFRECWHDSGELAFVQDAPLLARMRDVVREYGRRCVQAERARTDPLMNHPAILRNDEECAPEGEC